MKIKILSLLTGVIILFGFIFYPVLNNSSLCADFNKTISAGVAKINTTPKTPIPMSGYGGRTGPFQGIHDDLFCTCNCFQRWRK